MGMTAYTAERFFHYQQALAQGYGVSIEDVVKTFNVSPAAAQILRDKIVAQSTFLKKINVLDVKEMTGQVVFGSVNTPVTSTTDTNVKDRVPRDVLGLDPDSYTLHQVNSDVSIKYSRLDAWAHLTNFFEKMSQYVHMRVAKDMELVGWFGESIAATSDVVANPLLQDVGIGWLQLLRTKRPSNFLIEGKVAGEIRIGPGGDFNNIDHAVADLKLGIPEHLRSGVVALIGDELSGGEATTLYAGVADDPRKKLAAAASLGMYGGLNWETPSNFPGRGLVLTAHENLSIYTQKGSRRKSVVDNPKRDQIEDYNSRNEAHVVEDTEAMVGVEFKNVKIPDGEGGWK